MLIHVHDVGSTYARTEPENTLHTIAMNLIRDLIAMKLRPKQGPQAPPPPPPAGADRAGAPTGSAHDNLADPIRESKASTKAQKAGPPNAAPPEQARSARQRGRTSGEVADLLATQHLLSPQAGSSKQAGSAKRRSSEEEAGRRSPERRSAAAGHITSGRGRPGSVAGDAAMMMMTRGRAGRQQPDPKQPDPKQPAPAGPMASLPQKRRLRSQHDDEGADADASGMKPAAAAAAPAAEGAAVQSAHALRQRATAQPPLARAPAASPAAAASTPAQQQAAAPPQTRLQARAGLGGGGPSGSVRARTAVAHPHGGQRAQAAGGGVKKRPASKRIKQQKPKTWTSKGEVHDLVGQVGQGRPAGRC